GSPAVGQGCGSAQRPRRAPTDPDGYVILDRAGVDDHAAERIELTVVGRFADGQRGAKRSQRVVATGSAVVEGSADQVDLFLETADADPQNEPAVADFVQGAVALGDLERVVICEHQHVGGQPYSLGACGQVAQGGQRIPVAGAAASLLGCG